MAKKEIIVYIYLPGSVIAIPAGIFYHDSDLEVGTFMYGEQYLKRIDAVAVDPVSIPLEFDPSPETVNYGLYGAFRDAAPDYWGRLIIASELNTAPEALSEIDYLLQGNATRVGNLDFRIALDSPEPKLSPPSFDQLKNIIGAADNIAAGKSVETHILHLLRQGSSIGGARPKCTVEWKNELWLAKFPAKDDFINIPLIEYANMTLAEQCGIEIPEIKLKTIAGKDVFLIKRFDRIHSSEGWERKGFISSLSLMRLDEKDRTQWSYISIAALMRRYCLPETTSKLFRRMLFNILVRNTDDHPRNHGFILNGNDCQLSPAYDILPTMTHIGVGTEFNLAMTVGVFGKQATIKNALSSCEQFGLSKMHAKEIIDHVTAIVKEWKKVFSNCGVSDREIELLEPSFTPVLFSGE